MLETDHKPLITILGSKKGLPVYTANRLLRWGTILLNYDFHIKHLSSKNIIHADTLSRLVPSQEERFEESIIANIRADYEVKSMVNNIVRELPVTTKEIKKEAESNDFILEIKSKMVANDQKVQEIYSICDGILLYGERVVVPKKLQKRILRDFHMGHPGINRTKSLMRSFVYWKGMDVDIENMVHRCKGCALAAKAPPIVHKPWPKTDHPWTRLHIDFAGPVEDYYYLIVVDSFTKWPEVLRCKKPTFNTTTTFLHELYARFGVPECIVSDNGTQFTSKEFKEFCELYQINHITTPPYHPRSNGLAERFVDTLKRALKKASRVPTEKALQQFLQVYRITPNQRTQSNMAPAELMFARKIKSVFDKLLPGKNRVKNTMYTARKRYTAGEKVFFKCYRNNVEFWE